MMNFSTSTSNLKKSGFLVTVFLSVLFLTPIFYASWAIDKNFLTFRKAILNNNAEVVIFGNSINNARSACDSDLRSLSEMLEGRLGKTVLDISRGGMPISEFYSFSKLFNDTNKPEVVVIPIAGYQQSTFSEMNTVDRNKVAIKDLVLSIETMKPLYIMPSISTAFMKTETLSYKSRYYGDYSEVKLNFMSVEKNKMECPENNGFDMQFVEFMHWKNYGRPLDIDNKSLNIFAQFLRNLHQNGISVYVYMVPINHELITLNNDKEVSQTLEMNLELVRDSMDKIGVPYLDLSMKLGSSNFTDRYCACGHLNDLGRAFVASELASYIQKNK